jgi:hypothetical protein
MVPGDGHAHDVIFSPRRRFRRPSLDVQVEAHRISGREAMRFLVLVKPAVESEAGRTYEAGCIPTVEELKPMGAFNETLSRDGILLAMGGLQPTSKASRISFATGKPAVTDGPFTESKELVAGFWILQGRSKEEIVERLSRAPFMRGEQVEIRQVFEPEDLGL